MADLRWDIPETEEVEVDEETLAGIDRGIADMENGRWYTAEEVRQMIPQWISKYASQKRR
jgi:predicted transcriptional regulator